MPGRALGLAMRSSLWGTRWPVLLSVAYDFQAIRDLAYNCCLKGNCLDIAKFLLRLTKRAKNGQSMTWHGLLHKRELLRLCLVIA